MIQFAALAALLLSASATATPTADAPVERIEYDTNYWGRVVSGWEIGSEGKGTWYERVNNSDQTGPSAPYQVRYHDFDVGKEGFAELQELVAGLPNPATGSSSCRQFIPDNSYGSLRLISGATTREIHYNHGCMDAPYRRFISQLRAANALVANWGKAAPVARTERYASDGYPITR